MSFINYDMDELIDEILFQNHLSQQTEFDEFIDSFFLEPVQEYHGIRGYKKDVDWDDEEKQVNIKKTKEEQEWDIFFKGLYSGIRSTEEQEWDIFFKGLYSGIRSTEEEKAIHKALYEKKLEETKNELKEIKQFVKYNNARGKLYYMNMILFTQEHDGDRTPKQLRVFGKINQYAFNFLVKRNTSFNPAILEKVSKLFRFKELYVNISSYPAGYEIKELRLATNDERIDYENRIIRKNPLDNKQVTFINPQTDRFVKFGKICSDEFYLKNGCMISCFLEIFYKRLAINEKNIRDLKISNLYKIATGRDFEIGKEDYGITLREASKWCDRFNFELLAIDYNGKIIFQYTPKIVSKKIIGGNLWRILIHSDHVFNISENLKEFDRIHSRNLFKNDNDKKNEKKVNVEIPEHISKNWSKLQVFEERTYEHIKNYSELIESKQNEFLTRDADSLFKECIINNTEPSNLRLNNGSILSFDVMVYDVGVIPNNLKICKVQSIDNFSNISNQPYDINMVVDKYQQLKFDKYLYELREILTPNNAISTYSDSLYKSFKTYQRGPIVSRLNKIEKFGEFLEIDINRAYCSNMLELDSIPVFSVFDEIIELKEYPINNDSFYLIECFNCDMVLMNRRFDFITGELLKYVNECNHSRTIDLKYKILGMCTPYKKIEIGDSLRNKIKEIYDDTTINNATKKNLVNILYGICNKTRNKKQLGKVFLSEDEAKDNGLYFDIKINESTTAYVVVKQTTQNLNSGFLPTGRIVLDKQRIKIHKLITTLKNVEIETYGVRTDALYVENNIPFNNFQQKLINDVLTGKISNGQVLYKNIGSLRISKKSNPNLSYKIFYDDNPEICEFSEVEPIRMNDFIHNEELKDESKMTNKNIIESKRFEEFNSLFDINLTIVKGIVGGSGKTYSVLKYYEAKKKKVLFVSPYNMLCDDLKKKNVKSITLYKLLGKSLENFEKKEGVSKAYDIKGIHAIHFEEIYLYNLNELTWIKNFIKNNNQIKFSSAGDEFQLKPVNDANNINMEYHNFMVHSMFKNCIILKTSKRVTDENEQKQMLDISNELKKDISGKLSIEKLKTLGIKFKSLKDAKKESNFLTSKHVSYLKQTTEELNEFIHNNIVHESGKYYIGQILLGTGKFGTKPNRVYKIKSIKSNKIIEIENYNGKVKSYDIKKMDCFKYNYANTCHAYQGMSLGDSIYIHNYNFNRVDNRWLYVAITRCSSMNVTIVL
jgi:hypothetical protein